MCLIKLDPKTGNTGSSATAFRVPEGPRLVDHTRFHVFIRTL